VTFACHSRSVAPVKTIELTSPLTPGECEERLRAAIDRDDLRWRLGSQPVIGRVSHGSVRLRKRIRYRNSFQTVLTGSLEESGAETLLRVRTGMSALTFGFMAFWLAAQVAIAILVLLAGNGRPMGLVLPLAMLTFGAGLVWLGRWLARHEAEFLIGYVADAIVAGSVPETGGSTGPELAGG
jgi:hypothetical protein